MASRVKVDKPKKNKSSNFKSGSKIKESINFSDTNKFQNSS